MVQDTAQAVAQTASTFPWADLARVVVTAIVGFLSTYFGSKHGVVSASNKVINITQQPSSIKMPPSLK